MKKEDRSLCGALGLCPEDPLNTGLAQVRSPSLDGCACGDVNTVRAVHTLRPLGMHQWGRVRTSSYQLSFTSHLIFPPFISASLYVVFNKGLIHALLLQLYNEWQNNCNRQLMGESGPGSRSRAEPGWALHQQYGVERRNSGGAAMDRSPVGETVLSPPVTTDPTAGAHLESGYPC